MINVIGFPLNIDNLLPLKRVQLRIIMNVNYCKIFTFLFIIFLSQAFQQALATPLVHHFHIFQSESDQPHSLFSKNSTSAVAISQTSPNIFPVAYGYNEEGTTEGFEGQAWDYFTMSQTPMGAAFLTAANNAHLRRLHLWITQGSRKDSLSEIRYILIRIPNHPRALVMAELIEKLFKKEKFALTAYKKALNIYPQYALTHAQYGRYLTKIGKRSEGIKSLQQAIQMDPKLAVGHAWLAMAYQRDGQKDLAKSSGQIAKKLGYKGKISGL